MTLRVTDVGAVARMPDDHPAQVDALFFEDALLFQPRRSPAWVWVEIGTPVRLCAWATARSTRSTPGVTRARRWRT